MIIATNDPRVNLFDAVMAYRDGEKYPLIDQMDMFKVPQFAATGALYVVRTNGWNKKDAPIFWVCKGGLAGRPWAGPFKTATEAEGWLK